MINPRDLAGSFPALITFMKPNTTAPGGFAVDFEGSAKHARNVVRAGSAGVLIAGTTGQSATLTHDEQTELAHVVAEAARGRSEATGPFHPRPCFGGLQRHARGASAQPPDYRQGPPGRPASCHGLLQ